MTDNFLIRLENVSKTFKVDYEIKSFKNYLFNIFRKQKSSYKKNIYALKNISFSLKKGEIIGIIGPNGAGKTTILKIIAGIYQNDSGNLKINGRVIALLDHGIGFYPDISGLENIYFFASIFNIDKSYVDDNLKEILSISGIGEFINIPVKKYSSGMNLRLSFATFSLLNPEILLIDEIFQAGDIEFHKKSLNLIEKLISKSYGVILVSHNMHIIKNYCKRAIYIEKGELIKKGNAIEVVNYYLRSKGERLHGTTF